MFDQTIQYTFSKALSFSLLLFFYSLYFPIFFTRCRHFQATFLGDIQTCLPKPMDGCTLFIHTMTSGILISVTL